MQFRSEEEVHEISLAQSSQAESNPPEYSPQRYDTNTNLPIPVVPASQYSANPTNHNAPGQMMQTDSRGQNRTNPAAPVQTNPTNHECIGQPIQRVQTDHRTEMPSQVGSVYTPPSNEYTNNTDVGMGVPGGRYGGKPTVDISRQHRAAHNG